MITVGVRELKQRTSELIRLVREERREIKITFHGKVIARLIPVESMPAEEELNSWAELDELATKIGKYWPSNVSAVEAVMEGRR